MRHKIVILTFCLLVIGFIASIAWFLNKPDYEPALTSIAMLATITGLFIDRWLAARERRRELLIVLVYEIYMNIQVLSDKNFGPDITQRATPRVYPRLYITSLETVISSGAFIEPQDRDLFRLLNSWRQRAGEVNQRLDVTEMRTFMNPNQKELQAFHNALIGGVVLKTTRASLKELAEHLMSKYAKESGINRDTVLFSNENNAQ